MISVNKSIFKIQKLKIVLIVFLAVSTIAFLSPKIETTKAQATTFGKTDVGYSSDTITPGIIFGSKFTASANGTITSIQAYIWSATTGQAEALVYSDVNGVPKSLLATTTSQGMFEVPTWRQFSVNLDVTQGTAYWLCLVSGTDNTVYYFDSGQTSQFVTGTSSFPNLPTTFQNPSYANNAMSIYASYASTGPSASPTPAPTPTPTPVLTSTPAPTSTPTPATSPTATPTPQSTPTPSATSSPSVSPSNSQTPSPSIPEFPSFVALPILLALAMLSVVLYKRKASKSKP